MLKDEFQIDIIGRQVYPEAPDQTEEISLRTTGTYSQRGGAKFIAYKEYDEENPRLTRTTVLKVEPNRVTMMKPGSATRLILEKGQRNLCLYDTGFGTMSVGVFAGELTSTLDDRSGTLNIKYTLEIDSNLASTNELEVRVRPCSER